MSLFEPISLGPIRLSNRIVMAPMTRSRALGGVPNDLMRRYYEQRASAGLIITEGTAPSPDALGYPRIPGIFSDEQVEGFRRITDAVHAAGGRIFVQLMHVGRIAHPLNLPKGARVVAPSAVQAEGQMYTDAQGPQPFASPAALGADELAGVRDEFVVAARNALRAGFDGVELHAANGYLLEQFLHPHTNRRDDAYGGDAERRARFVGEVAEGVAQAIGKERVGMRLSPFNVFNDMAAHPQAVDAHLALVARLPELAYLHVVEAEHPDTAATVAHFRRAFGGALILNGGYDRARAEATIESGAADLISFGRPFIANPDFPARARTGADLAVPDGSTFYTPGAEGYVDYPALDAASHAPSAGSVVA